MSFRKAMQTWDSRPLLSPLRWAHMWNTVVIYHIDIWIQRWSGWPQYYIIECRGTRAAPHRSRQGSTLMGAIVTGPTKTRVFGGTRWHAALTVPVCLFGWKFVQAEHGNLSQTSPEETVNVAVTVLVACDNIR